MSEFGPQQQAGAWKGLGHQADSITHPGARCQPLQLVHNHRRLAARFALDVDHTEDRLNLLLVAGTGQRGQTLGIGGIRAEGRARHGRLQHGDRAGGRDGLERIQGHLRSILRRRLGVQPVDQRLDTLVILGRGPGDELAHVGAQRKVGFGKGRAEDAERVQHGRRGRLMFQFVDGDRRLARGHAFDVDVRENRLQHLLLARLGNGHQLAFVRSGRQLGGWNGRGQHAERSLAGDMLQLVHLGGRFGCRDLLFRHLFDRPADGLVVPGGRPGGQAACLRVDGQASFRHQAGEHLDEGLRICVTAGVNDQLRLVLVVRPRLQLLDGLGDHLLVRLVGPDEDLVGPGIGHDFGIG